MEDYLDVFGGRQDDLQTLNDFLRTSSNRCALLLAPAGRGKTALLVQWIDRDLRSSEDWYVVFHPINNRYSTDGLEATFRSLLTSLSHFHGERLDLTNPSPDEFRGRFRDLLTREPPEGRRLLVILDAMDEASGWSMDRTFLPANIPEHVRLVFSARVMAGGWSHDQWCEEFGWARGQTEQLHLETMTEDEVADVLRRMGNPLDALAVDETTLYHIGRICQGEPLTIKLLVESLRDGEVEPGALPGVRTLREHEGLRAFIQLWLEQLDERIGKDAVVGCLLDLCAAALGPLNFDTLSMLDGDTFIRASVARTAVKNVRRFIIGRGEEQEGYVFAHPELRRAFFDGLSERRKRELRRCFVALGDRCLERRLESEYVRQFWVGHLAECDKWERMGEVLVDLPPVPGDGLGQPVWLDARYRVEGNHTGYLTDLDVLWRHAEASDDLVVSFRCALIASTLRSLSGNLLPELLVGLVQVGTPEGRWSAAAALEHVRQMPDASRQADAIEALVKSGVELPHRLALEVAHQIGDARHCVRAVCALVPAHVGLGLEVASLLSEGLQHDGYRARVLAAVAPHLPEDVLSAAQNIQDDGYRAQVLAAVAPHLSEDEQREVWADALSAAQNIQDDGSRAQVLSAVAPHLPEDVLGASQNIQDDGSRARVLAAVAPHLPEDEQQEVWAEALGAAQNIQHDWSRAQVLAAVAPHLPEDVLGAAQNIQDDGSRAQVLAAVAPHLPAEGVERNTWMNALRQSAARHRPGLFQDIVALMPWLKKLTSPDELRAILQTIQATVTVWP